MELFSPKREKLRLGFGVPQEVAARDLLYTMDREGKGKKKIFEKMSEC